MSQHLSHVRSPNQTTILLINDLYVIYQNCHKWFRIKYIFFWPIPGWLLWPWHMDCLNATMCSMSNDCELFLVECIYS